MITYTDFKKDSEIGKAVQTNLKRYAEVIDFYKGIQDQADAFGDYSGKANKQIIKSITGKKAHWTRIWNKMPS